MNLLQKYSRTIGKNTGRGLGITGILLMLSVSLGICALVMTLVPCQMNWLEVLLQDNRIVFRNILPVFCIMLILYLLINRVWIAFLSTGILVFAIAEINRFKIAFRDDPFVFSDVLLIGEAKNMLGQYKLYLDKVSAFALIFIAITTVLCFFVFRFRAKNKWVRFVGAAVVAVAFIISIKLFYFEDNETYNQTWHWEFGNQWKNTNQYMSRGVIYSFIRSIPNAVISKPEGYDENKVQEVLNKYQNQNLPEDKRVHIISIMLEAYNDFSEFEGIEFVNDPYENFHALQEQSYSGKLFTDIFAAGTITTERSFLTGYQNPRFYDRDTMSYVRYFKSQGYYTEAMHPCYGWFYDRQNVNTYLGFNQFDYYENKYKFADKSALKTELYHGLLGDNDFFDYIIEGYEKAVKNDKLYFNFSVTYQNHGPYASVKESDEQYVLRKDEYSEADYYIFDNYLRGISRTDKALKKLWDYVAQQEEPIVLILFGDHNPWLGDGNSVYDMLGIDLNLDTPQGAVNYYETPYLFYANESAKQQLNQDFVGTGATVSPMFLMNEFFECIDAKGPAYLNYLADVKKQYSVLNRVYVGSEEKYYLRNELNQDNILLLQEQVEYYVKIKQ